MVKRLVVYKIKQEKARLAFGAVIAELDPNCRVTIVDSAMTFESDKNLNELFPLLMDTGITADDQFGIFTVTDFGKGFGIDTLEGLSRDDS